MRLKGEKTEKGRKRRRDIREQNAGLKILSERQAEKNEKDRMF